jgi:integrase/recombinase XerD
VLLQADSATLLIRESKFHKSRIVPLHTSTAQQLMIYLDQRDGLGERLQTTALFLSRRGKRLSYEMLQACFRKLSSELAFERVRASTNRPCIRSGTRL